MNQVNVGYSSLYCSLLVGRMNTLYGVITWQSLMGRLNYSHEHLKVPDLHYTTAMSTRPNPTGTVHHKCLTGTLHKSDKYLRLPD